MYYKNAIAAIVVFDVTSRDSFEKCQKWVKELNEKAQANILITIAGNKIDLDDRQVSKEDAEHYASEQKLHYCEVSAKQNVGVEEMFKELAQKLPQKTTNQRINSLRIKQKNTEAEEGYGASCGC